MKDHYLETRLGIDYTFCISKTCKRECARNVKTITDEDAKAKPYVSMALFKCENPHS